MNYALDQKTPVKNVGLLERFFKDKIVYDVGAAAGDFARGISMYAKRTVAVEITANMPKHPGVENITGDFMHVGFQEAEVIYIFMSFIGNYNLTRKLKEDGWHGTVVSALYPLFENPAEFMKPGEIIHGHDMPFLIYNI